MEFTCHTAYNLKALTAAARALRRTLRAKKSRVSRLYAWIISGLLALSLWLSWGEVWKSVINGAVLAALLLIQWKEDAVNGYFAKRRAMPGTDAADTAFYPDCFVVKTAASESKWQYDRILALAESGGYLIFVMGKNHAMPVEKAALQGGDISEFRHFIEEKSGQQIRKIGRT